jgi:hypothetical protein
MSIETIVPIDLTPEAISDLAAITTCLQRVLTSAFGGVVKAEVVEIDARILDSGVRLNLHLRASSTQRLTASHDLALTLQEVAILKLQSAAESRKWKLRFGPTWC